MNARKATMVAVLSFRLLTQEESALAHEEWGGAQSRDFNCYDIKGAARDTWPGTGSVSTGVVTHSGFLNGTTQYVFDTDAFPTPDPDMVTFGAELTLTTNYGLVKARVVNLFNVATGIWTSIGTIDPKTSTGKFVGSTGTLWYPRGTTISLDNGAQTYPSDLVGQLCLAAPHRDKGHQRK